MRATAGLVVALAVVTGILLARGQAASHENCRTGDAQGFAAVRWSPEVASTIPPRFTKAGQFFWRRYNCTGLGVAVKRLDRGVYDVYFPGLGYRLAITDAISQDGVSSSVQPFGTGVFRVIMRGPTLEQGLLERRDAPFAIVVY